MIFLVALTAKLVRRRIDARRTESASGTSSRSSVLAGAGGPQ